VVTVLSREGASTVFRKASSDCVATGVDGAQFHRDHRYPGTHPVILGRFFALTAAWFEARGLTAAVDEQRGSGLGSPPVRRKSVWVSVASPVEDEGFSAFGQALSDDLGIEGVREYLGPILERSVGGDGGGASHFVAL
jgi:hypothetical protein